MFEMPPTRTKTSLQSLPPLTNNCVNNVLLQSTPDFSQSLCKFVMQIIDTILVHTVLHEAQIL